MGKTEPEKAKSRVLRFLAQGAATIADAAAREKVLLDAGPQPALVVDGRT